MRIAFITDVHLDATPAGWQHQPRWCDGIDTILSTLETTLPSLHVDLIIYGGDLVERGTPDAIDRAVERLARIKIPAAVCLGNHDLTEVIAYPYWRRAMWNWPAAAFADRCLEFPECDVIALNIAWRTPAGTGSLWDGQYPVPAAQPEQLAQLSAWLSRRPDKPAILAIHAPLVALPPELTGQPEPMEVPPADFSGPFREIIAKYPRLRLVLAGHCHATCATHIGTCVHLTSTSLTEVPYAFPLIEVINGRITVESQTLAPFTDGPALNPAKSWVIGQAGDRALKIAKL